VNGKPDAGTASAELARHMFLPNKRDMLLCVAWIGAILLIGGLLWFFTQPYRTRILTQTVNKTLARHAGRERIAEQPLFPGNPAVGGVWFELVNSDGRAFVFTMMRNGNSTACVALTHPNGKVKTILPLGSSAEQIIEKLPLPVYHFYANRIEQDPRKKMGGRKR